MATDIVTIVIEQYARNGVWNASMGIQLAQDGKSWKQTIIMNSSLGGKYSSGVSTNHLSIQTDGAKWKLEYEHKNRLKPISNTGKLTIVFLKNRRNLY